MALHFTTSYLEDALDLFRQSKKLAERGMEQVTEEQLFTPLDPETNSIAVIVKHLSGNMRSRWTDFLTTDGEKPDRNRDGEFLDPPPTRQALMETWEDGWGGRSSRLSSYFRRRIWYARSPSAANRTRSCRLSTARWRTMGFTWDRSFYWQGTSPALDGNR
jgi:hypothetical protein